MKMMRSAGLRAWRGLCSFSRAARGRSTTLLALTFALLVLAPATPSPAHATPDSKGTDFWLMFTGNYGTTDQTLFITSGVNTSGTVTVPGLGFSQPFNVVANTVTSIPMPAGVDIQASDAVQNLGIHVTATDEVTVYGLSRRQYTTDAFLGLPTDILGTDYLVLAYQNVDVIQGTQFGVVGTVNGTTVTITPAVTTGARLAGVPYNIVLNQGQTYMLRNTNAFPADLSGTIVTADQPFGMFGGHQCANIPQGAVACDYVVEQLPPTSAWGRNFVTVPLATRLNGDTFRFLAQNNGTTVNINGAPVANLNRGQYHEQILTGYNEITSNEPILTSQYSNSSSFDNVVSDPFMVLISPVEQFQDGYTVTTPATGFAQNFINIVVPNAAVGSVTVDGVPVPAGSYTAIGSSGYSGAQVSVTLGAHNITSALPFAFGITVYGFDDYDSYGYPGGLSLAPVARVTALELTPVQATNPINTQHCVTATVFDQDHNPLAGIGVVFTVIGANPQPGFATTDSTGQASFCYTGTNGGLDSIFASVGTVSDSATKTWIDNRDPICAQAVASSPTLWPPNHQYHSIAILGVTDPDGDPVTITVTGITQDEPTNARGDGNTCPDGQIAGGTASVRAERSGTPGAPGNGRVYEISFRAEDGRGGSCTGSVLVCVPHDQGAHASCIDDGRRYDALGPCSGANELTPEVVVEYDLQVGAITASGVQLRFALPAAGQADIAAFDISGRRMATIENAWLPGGVHDQVWDFSNVPNGLYFVRMRAGDVMLTRRVLKVR